MAGEFPLEKQLQSQWCWAAVTRAVDRYFDSESKITQCKVAVSVLGQPCCPKKEACNRDQPLDIALRKFNRLDGTPTSAPLSFEQIRASIDAAIPICVRIEWPSGAGHFVVISGYKIGGSGKQLVEVADPLFLNSTIPYDDLKSLYQNPEEPEDAGFWSHTYRVKS